MGGGAGFMSSRGTREPLDAHHGHSGRLSFSPSMGLAWIAGADRKPTSILGTAPATQSQPGGRFADHPADQWRPPGFAEKADEQQASRRHRRVRRRRVA